MNKPHTISQAMSCVGWRLTVRPVLQAMRALGLIDTPEDGADIYQFGVFEGESMRQLRDEFPAARLIGFDSFQGLPQEAETLPIKPAWRVGAYNSGDLRHYL